MSAKAPTNSDWSFSEIERCFPDRAACLEAAESPIHLLGVLEAALQTAIKNNDLRYGLDFHENNPRVTVQFLASRHVYDWFFSARTGYRAQFWIAPQQGDKYNIQLMTLLSNILFERLPEQLVAQKIRTDIVGDSREEFDEGSVPVEKGLLRQSFKPDLAKIWPCERLIQQDGSDPRETLFALVADRDLPKLDVPRWSNAMHPSTRNVGEGLRAPYPDQEKDSWLDLKGGFVASGAAYQTKLPSVRANSLFERGWT
jgi:hypothetical protein